MTKLKLTGRVVHPGDPGWDDARKGFNQRFDVEPRAIVFCQNARDAANAVLWARENHLPFRARSGRHSYEGYCLIQDGLIIDLSDLDTVSVDRERRTAQIGAGIHMLECSESLGQVGVTIPLATGPTVGLAGLTLGGGFGLTSRKLGLTCDNLMALELVTADGEILFVNPRRHPDLFWACRGGGGGNFGIATRFMFRVHPVSFAVAFMVQWGWDQFEPVVAAWQDWAWNLDKDVSTALQLTVTQTIKLYGLYTPDNPNDLAKAAQLLAPLFQAVPPPSAPGNPTIQPLPFNVATRLFYGEAGKTVNPQDPVWDVIVHDDQQIYKSTSAAAMTPFSPQAIGLLKQYLESAPPLDAPPVQPSMVQLLGGGGVAAGIAPDATAVYLRQARFIVQYDGFWSAPADGQETIDWIQNFRSALLPYTQGAYVNYVDSSIPNYLQAYYGPNLPRLVKVKKQYDPHNVFNFPQSIPLQL